MGCDIHGVWQRRAGNVWLDVPSNYDERRDYQLFAVLADVRNGYGFAGVQTGETVQPISEPRGLPDDFLMVHEWHPLNSLALSDVRRRFSEDQQKKMSEVWLGEHSYSWLTGDEMMRWYATAPTVEHCGVLSVKQYEQWDGHSEPKDYVYGIVGRVVITVDEREGDLTPGWTHIRCYWMADLKSDLKYFFDEVQRLMAVHGEIRFVFGFDN